MADPISVDIRDAGVEAMLQQLLARTDDLSPAMGDIARILVNATEDAFLNQASPFGFPWEPLSDATLEEAARQGRTNPRILQDTGQLAGSVASDFGSDFAELSVGKVYAGIHQFGGQAGRGGRVHIPARPYAPVDEAGELPDQTTESILDVLSDYLIA